MTELITNRLVLKPFTTEELAGLAEACRDTQPELCRAYREMLDSCLAHPQQHVWFTLWQISTKTGKEVGFAGFRGLLPGGSTEIGYGMNPGCEGNGYATEGVAALCRWAFSQPGVKQIEAEAEAENTASIRVLQKTGFCPTGKMGQEGPRFVLKKTERDTVSCG